MNKEYIKILPILGGILSLIALLFPAVYLDTVILFRIEVYIWFNGYCEITALGETESGYLRNPIFGFCTLLVIISSLITITNIKIQKEILWLIMPIIQIFAVLIWLAAIPSQFPDLNFWAWFDIGFGIIGIIIGNCLTITGFIILKCIE